MLLRYNKFLKYFLLFHIGGFAYGGIEILSRGYSHISMMIAGGICFIFIGLINEVFPGKIGFVKQMAISALIITFVEFITGLIVNIWLGLGVWDYSSLPFNLLGQVSILYTLIWFLISPIAIISDDYLRYYLWGEDKPNYRIK